MFPIGNIGSMMRSAAASLGTTSPAVRSPDRRQPRERTERAARTASHERINRRPTQRAEQQRSFGSPLLTLPCVRQCFHRIRILIPDRSNVHPGMPRKTSPRAPEERPHTTRFPLVLCCRCVIPDCRGSFGKGLGADGSRRVVGGSRDTAFSDDSANTRSAWFVVESKLRWGVTQRRGDTEECEPFLCVSVPLCDPSAILAQQRNFRIRYNSA